LRKDLGQPICFIDVPPTRRHAGDGAEPEARADEDAERITMTQGARAKGRSKEVMSSIRTARWLFGVILACWSSAAGLQVLPEPSGVGQSAASRTREARPAQPSVLPADLPRIVASATHRQEPIRGHDGKSFGMVPEGVPLPLVAQRTFAPILCSGVLWPALVRAFEPRGPPSLIV